MLTQNTCCRSLRLPEGLMRRYKEEEHIELKRKWTHRNQSKTDVIGGNNREPIGARLRGRTLTNERGTAGQNQQWRAPKG